MILVPVDLPVLGKNPVLVDLLVLGKLFLDLVGLLVLGMLLLGKTLVPVDLLVLGKLHLVPVGLLVLGMLLLGILLDLADLLGLGKKIGFGLFAKYFLVGNWLMIVHSS